MTQDPEHETVQQLMERRKEIETQIDDFMDVLRSHNCDMDSPLVSAEGFPRSDIDVPQVRTTRVEIIRLRQDWKDVMAKIEVGLHEYFRNAESGGDSNASGGHTAVQSSSQTHVAFATVQSVAEDSPAQQAGLQNGDRIVSFGNATAANHQQLSKLATIVKDYDKKSLNVKVLRGGELVTLQLTPDSSYSGRGSLGCHLLPL